MSKILSPLLGFAICKPTGIVQVAVFPYFLYVMGIFDSGISAILHKEDTDFFSRLDGTPRYQHLQGPIPGSDSNLKSYPGESH